jgi:hypothetical protein
MSRAVMTLTAGRTIDVAAIPAELQSRPRWMLWRFEPDDQGTLKKPPYQVAAPQRRASSTNSETWGTFAAAVAAVAQGHADGIGFALGDGFCGFDIDHCLNPETGVLDEDAQGYIALLNSYTEVSPSGDGIHVVMFGTKPPDCTACKTEDKRFELYDHGRYFTVTGRHRVGTPTTLHERTREIAIVAAQLFPAAAPADPLPFSTSRHDDATVLDRARRATDGEKFCRLFDAGSTVEYGGDDSAADLALCGLLAFWTERDALRMDRLFRQSALMRSKWDEHHGDQTYGARTIAKAIAGCRTTVRTNDFEQRVTVAVEREQVRREARRRVDAEERGPLIVPQTFASLTELLNEPEPGTSRMRIDTVHPAEGRIVWSGKGKGSGGKTTARDNLIRSLVDGDPFLGRFTATPIVDGTVAVIDTEMSKSMLKTWWRDQDIRHHDRVCGAVLRGQAHAFDLRDRYWFGWWRDWLRDRQARYAVLDALREVLDACGLDEHTQAGAFLTLFGRLLQDAGVTECCVIHHFGHVFERERGDSRIGDWGDAKWRLLTNEKGQRFFAVDGRDVSLPESELDYEPRTRRLTLKGGSRADAELKDALGAIIEVVTASPGLSQNKVEEACAGRGIGQKAVRLALNEGLQLHVLAYDSGPRKSKLFRVIGGRPQ